MNYYEHHIGDYAEATAHLSILEDGVYTRLLRKYYASEHPLPADVKVLARQIGARTKEERAAVDAVLADFFELRTDGWHQDRCDAEIEAFHAKQASRADAKENGKARQRRTRERRKVLFEQLRAHGQVPAYNATTTELEALLSRVTSGDQSRPDAPAVTRDESGPVTRDETASPDSNPQSPDTSHQTPERKPPQPPSGSAPLDLQLTEPLPEQPEYPAGFLTFWAVWPKSQRKGGKGTCAELWKRGKCEAIAGEICAHVKERAERTDWSRDNGAYVEAPERYLRARRWEGAELNTGAGAPSTQRARRQQPDFATLDYSGGDLEQ